MKLTDDLSPKWIYVKGLLFAVILVASAYGLLMDKFELKQAFLVCLLIWSSARLYYFLFYVIERYVDPSYRFSGIASFVRYILQKSR